MACERSHRNGWGFWLVAEARWFLGYKAKGTMDTTIKVYDCKENQSYTKDLVIKDLQ